MPALAPALIIAIGSAAWTWASRRSLLRPRSHGFPRFFAVEAILCLLVLNAPRWFDRPFAPLQLLSWLLLTASFFLAAHGLVLLVRLGKPTPAGRDSPLFTFENASNLVTAGAYRFIRHPLYASLLCLAWGALLKTVSPPTLLLGLVATGFLVATAKAEEAENVARFGRAYHDYMARTRLFIPFLF